MAGLGYHYFDAYTRRVKEVTMADVQWVAWRGVTSTRVAPALSSRRPLPPSGERSYLCRARPLQG